MLFGAMGKTRQESFVKRRIGILLAAGIAMPFLYFVALFVAGSFYPGYSHIQQVASDLGAADSPYRYAPLFNFALIAVGAAVSLPTLAFLNGYVWKRLNEKFDLCDADA